MSIGGCDSDSTCAADLFQGMGGPALSPRLPAQGVHDLDGRLPSTCPGGCAEGPQPAGDMPAMLAYDSCVWQPLPLLRLHGCTPRWPPDFAAMQQHCVHASVSEQSSRLSTQALACRPKALCRAHTMRSSPRTQPQTIPV